MDNATARILAELGAIRAEMATRADLDRVRGDIMARIDRLQDELTGVREGDELTWASVRRAEKMARSTVESERDSDRADRHHDPPRQITRKPR